MRGGVRRGLTLAAGVAVGLSAWTSSGSAQVIEFGASAERVMLNVVAVDKHGHPVRDLKRREFLVFDEGRPQRLTDFAHASDLKARVLLLVDASGSMDERLKTTSTRMALMQLVAALAPEDEVALAGFDSRYFGLVPFSTNHQAIFEKLSDLRPFGSTALNDALEHAARDLASHGEGRRAVIVVTDGVDNASVTTPDMAIARSQALDVPIYALSVISPLDDPKSPHFVGKLRAGQALLARYTSLSGGRAFNVSDFAGLQRAAREIMDELRHQYRLGYDPPRGPARLRRVEVRTTRRGVRVRTRTGYVPVS